MIATDFIHEELIPLFVVKNGGKSARILFGNPDTTSYYCCCLTISYRVLFSLYMDVFNILYETAEFLAFRQC